MRPGPARAISNPVPTPWADPSLNASNAQQPRERSELELAPLECFLLEKPYLLIRQQLPIHLDSPSLPWGSTTMGHAPAAAAGHFAPTGEVTLSLSDGFAGRTRREAAAHRPRRAEIIRKTNLRSEAMCRLGALRTGTHPPWTRDADPPCVPFQA